MRFRDNYWFLSNMFPCIIHYEGFFYNSVEHAYQTAACLFEEDKLKMKECKDGFEAKKLSYKVVRRSDWDDIKESVMKDLLYIKFGTGEMQRKLLATGDIEIIEENHWGDTFWGVCKGKGQNKLGKMLKQIRKNLQEGKNGKN